MRQSLQVRLSQHLALTPQLQQSIRLLQLSTLELHQEVEQMLESNPFLELEEDSAPPWEVSLDRASQAASTTPTADTDAQGSDGFEGPDALSEVAASDFGSTERDD